MIPFWHDDFNTTNCQAIDTCVKRKYAILYKKHL